jgi:predicted DNA-binding protein (MmcQ/YjbR family)
VFQQQALFARSLFARARRVCLALPEANETSSHGHPNFRAGKKTFCAFEIHKNRPSIAVKLPLAEFDAQVAQGLMFATPYGRGSWVSLWVDGDEGVNWRELTRLIRRAYDGVATKRMRTVAGSLVGTQNRARRRPSGTPKVFQ